MGLSYMLVSSVDLQRDAILGAGVNERHLYCDKASGARDEGLPGYLKEACRVAHTGWGRAWQSPPVRPARCWPELYSEIKALPLW
jgi:hypothetical protein